MLLELAGYAKRLEPPDLLMAKKKKKKHGEDLFKDTTMTFGEHLEELRVCLWRAILGLAVGFVIGLLVGGWVVDLIQWPLQNALQTYYQKQSLEWVEAERKKLAQAGGELPWTKEQIEDIVNERGLLPEEVFVDAVQLLRELKKVDPELFGEVELPQQNAEGKLDRRRLMPVIIFRQIEGDLRVRAKSLKPHEAFMTYIKASLMVGVLVASPWIFYQIWSFVAAGLYPHEKKYIHVFLPFSVGLFLAGAATAFLFVMKPVLDFLFFFNSKLGIDPEPRISEWLGFVLVLPLGFGIAFQLPLVMLFLERIGIFDVHAYLSKWRIAVLIIFVLSMFLTPADPYSMILMAVPLTVLYFGGILLCKYMPRSRSPFDELEDEEKTKKARRAEEPKRRRSSFLPRLVIVMIVVGVVFGWQPLRKAYQQRAAVAEIKKVDGTVYYDFQFNESGERIEDAPLPGPGALRTLLGIDFFATVVEVDLSDCPAGDAELEYLQGLSGLRELNLTGTEVTEQGVEGLREALPECKIIFGPE